MATEELLENERVVGQQHFALPEVYELLHAELGRKLEVAVGVHVDIQRVVQDLLVVLRLLHLLGVGEALQVQFEVLHDVDLAEAAILPGGVQQIAYLGLILKHHLDLLVDLLGV